MSYVKHTSTQVPYHQGLKLPKNTMLDVNESSDWTWTHPYIQPTFYQRLPAPKDQADAKEKLKCHKDAIDDFQSQIEIIDLEIETLKEDSGNTLPYLVDEDVNLKNKKHKLLQSKRYHSNASKAYSYYLEKAG